MKPWEILFIPFRVFMTGNSFTKIKNTELQSSTGKVSATNQGQLRVKGKSMRPGSLKAGWRFGNFAATVAAFMLTTVIFLYLTAFIENTPEYLNKYTPIGLSNLIDNIGLKLPQGERGLFYQRVLASAVCSSEIALIQSLVMYFVLYLGIELLLKALGAVSSGNRSLNVRGVRAFMSMAMILMPAMGILSTVIGILSTDHVSMETAKMIIFGPSGLGIFGYLLATGFNSLADYFHEE